jgi:hypothetical protein
MLLVKQVTMSSTGSTSKAFTFIHSLHSARDNYIKAATWNVAAINNNPFEYWITNDADPRYNVLMSQVSSFITQPEEKDIPISSVFSAAMFQELLELLEKNGLPGTKDLQKLWGDEYANRRIISQFLKDGVLGKKRLISMPDRVTNTMQYTDPTTKRPEVLMRPTVINCYSGKSLDTMENWWTAWKEFLFATKVPSSKTPDATKFVYEMIPKIDRSKYPAISVEEEAISKSLAILHLALFDSILVHMMNTLNKMTWQDIRSTLCNNLNLHKNDRTIEILERSYADMQIIFLQETSNSFYHLLTDNTNKINQAYDIYRTAKAEDFHRDQNSILLVKKSLFVDVQEISSEVIQIFKDQLSAKEATAGGGTIAGGEGKPKKKTKLPIEDGDFFAVKATSVFDHACYLLASFHGDTNG